MSKIDKDEKEITLEDLVTLVTRHWRTMVAFVLLFCSLAVFNYRTNVSFTSKSILLFQKQGSSPLQTISANFTGVSLDNYWSEDKLEHHVLYLESPSFYRKLASDVILQEDYKELVIQFMGNNFYNYLDMSKEGPTSWELRLNQLTEKLAVNLWGKTRIKEVGPNSLSVSFSHQNKTVSVELVNLITSHAVHQISQQFVNEVKEVQAFFQKQIKQAELEIESMDQLIIELENDMASSEFSHQDLARVDIKAKLKEELARGKIELFKNKKVISQYGEAPSREPASEVLNSSKFSTSSKVTYLKDENKMLEAKLASIDELLSELDKANTDRTKMAMTLERLKRRLEFKSDFIMNLVSQSIRMDVMRISLENKVSILEKAQLARATRDGNLKTSVIGASGVGLMVSLLFIGLMSVLKPVVRSEKDISHLGMFSIGRLPNFSLAPARFDIQQGVEFFIADLVSYFSPLFKRWRKWNPFYGIWLRYQPLIRMKKSIYMGEGVENVFLSPNIERESLSSAEAQAFRSLRTHFLSGPYSNSRGGNIVSVVSPSVGAGKSYVASNFAGSLAHLGKKTLLIDCDTRNPTTSRLARAGRRKGLVDLLRSGKFEQRSEYVTKLSVGLEVIPAGRHNNRVPELLSSPELAELFSSLRENYDYIILDLPPMSKVAESIFLSKLSTFVLMVVSVGHSQLNELESAIDILKANGQLKIGSVLNKSGHPSEFFYFARPIVQSRQKSA